MPALRLDTLCTGRRCLGTQCRPVAVRRGAALLRCLKLLLLRSGQSKPLLWVGGTLALLAAAGACIHTSGYTPLLQARRLLIMYLALSTSSLVLCARLSWCMLCQAGSASGFAKCLSAQEWAAQSVLGRSGFLAAFALIFLSEIGDKTFFIAALLAMKVRSSRCPAGTCGMRLAGALTRSCIHVCCKA